MKKFFYIPATIAVSMLSAQAQAPAAPPAKATEIPKAAPVANNNVSFKKTTVKKTALQIELEKITQENTIRDARLKAELAEMKAETARIQAQRLLLEEKQKMSEFKQKAEEKIKQKAAEDLKTQLERDAAMAKSQAALASSELALEKTKLTRSTEIHQAEIKAIKTEKERKNFADTKPIYLENPLTDGTLTISDRRIALDGAIYPVTADYITERIHYFNNKDKKMPIFIVIGYSPGGSVMAGYRILKAMEGSDAPVYVVVKSFAASMAASITTLAKESYAYPNAIILHHQLSSSYFFTTMNLTQQKEAYEESQKWWSRLADPIAKKMGISTEEFIKQMYEKNSDGDWVEFGTDAKKLKWVNHIVNHIKETSRVVNPDSLKDKDKDKDDKLQLKEETDSEGRRCKYLPRINPHDVYFLHNPDGYYRLRK